MEFDLGKQIKRIRDNKNLSQDRFGKKVGLSGKTISAYETKRATPPLSVLDRIATVYEVTIFDIPRKQKIDLSTRINKINLELSELKDILETGLSL